jgi:hypothetical protein
MLAIVVLNGSLFVLLEAVMSRFKSCAIAIPLLVVMPGIVSGQEALRAQLKGHSVVVQYTEVVSGRRHTGELVWTQAIYVSSQGRLFVSVNRRGNSRRGYLHADITPGSNDSGGSTPFKWTKTGLTREWRDRRGRSLHQMIEIAQSQGRFTCKMVITRSGFASMANHQICTIVVGNPLGDINP